MVVYLLLKGLDFLAFGALSLIPTFETPSWFVTQLPDVLTRVASFNYYLPVFESVGIVIGLISFTLAYKILKITLNFVNIDLNS